MGSTELPHSQASKLAACALAVFNDGLKLAASTLGTYNYSNLEAQPTSYGSTLMGILGRRMSRTILKECLRHIGSGIDFRLVASSCAAHRLIYLH